MHKADTIACMRAHYALRHISDECPPNVYPLKHMIVYFFTEIQIDLQF